MPQFHDITGQFWLNKSDVLALPSDAGPEGATSWLIAVLQAANKLTKNEAQIVDASVSDSPMAELPDVHIEIDINAAFSMLHVTCWSFPIPEDGVVHVEFK
ncbi:hypothetical protein [Vibrio sp. 10N]|uniref:hypothetical protein n=1 Tax=Vibrio sp. 10N TaxID=3058938 RepID=UPI002814813C|nr:hypothetical protein VB10N_46500 [Vibrio sp. 10N]